MKEIIMKILKIKKISKVTYNSPRYDLTISKNHNFFANNILVHNCTVYPDGYIHARSLDGNKHPWQSWIKSYIQSWYKDIPQGWRVCGENLYPQHSIAYTFPNDGYFFQVFGIYNDKNECLSYDDTWIWCDILGLKMVDVFYYGKYDKDAIMQKFNKYQSNSKNEVEGFVIRNVDSFHYDNFNENVGKYVRANHVQTDAHWSENWKPNKVNYFKNVKEK